jgi:hypothetical protein
MQVSDFVNDVIRNENIFIRSITDDEIFCSNKFGRADFSTRLPLKITDEIAFIAGIIVGDGHLHNNKTGGKTIEISMVNRQIMLKVKESIEKAFWIRTQIKTLSVKYKQKLYRINFSNSLIWSLFNKLFEIPAGKKSFEVKEPICIKDNSELEKIFFSGLFLADGGMKHKSISYTTVSQKLFEHTEKFLTKIGISFVTRIWETRKQKNVYDIIINKKISKLTLLETLPLLKLKFAGVA